MKYVCSCGNPTDNETAYGHHICDDCLERIQKEVDWESQGEKYKEYTIICPYCGYAYDDYDCWEYEDSEDEVECPECGKHFDLEVYVKRSYSTKRSLCDMPDDYEGDEEE